mgnify:CR=1 FL=1
MKVSDRRCLNQELQRGHSEISLTFSRRDRREAAPRPELDSHSPPQAKPELARMSLVVRTAKPLTQSPRQSRPARGLTVAPQARLRRRRAPRRERRCRRCWLVSCNEAWSAQNPGAAPVKRTKHPRVAPVARGHAGNDAGLVRHYDASISESPDCSGQLLTCIHRSLLMLRLETPARGSRRAGRASWRSRRPHPATGTSPRTSRASFSTSH